MLLFLKIELIFQIWFNLLDYVENFKKEGIFNMLKLLDHYDHSIDGLSVCLQKKIKFNSDQSVTIIKNLKKIKNKESNTIGMLFLITFYFYYYYY